MSRLPAVTVVAALLVSSACHRPHQPTDSSVHPADGRRIINADAIEKTGARTAWEALQRTVPFFEFTDGNNGKAGHVEHRGRSSIMLQDQPMIIMDGVELNDYASLVVMPAADIAQIEVLTGIDATTYYGTGATKGVIRITTKVSGG